MKCSSQCTCKRHKTLADRAQFKGESAGVRTRHQRVVRRRGKASDHECVKCLELGRRTQARDWATVHGTDGEDPWADYIALCRLCHRSYDQIGARQRGVVRNPLHDARGRFAKVT